MNNKDDDQKFIESFSREASSPDDGFRRALREKTVARYQNNIFFNIFGMKKIQFLAITFSLVALAGVSLLSGLFVINMRSRTSANLTAEQKSEIYAKILQNNSRSSMNSAESSLAADTAAAAPGVAPIAFEKEVLRHTTVQTTAGPAKNQCGDFSYVDSGYTSEDYQYFGIDGSYYSKYSMKDKDGDLTSYGLNIQNPTKNESYIYQGGQYAVKFLYAVATAGAAEDAPRTLEEPLGSSVSSSIPTDTKSSALSYFGEDVDITSTVSINGADYYVIEYSYPSFCTQPYEKLAASSSMTIMPVESNDDAQYKIININYVNTNTFEISQTEQYLNEKSPENLLLTTKTNIESSKKSATEVASNFEFEFDVNVRELDYRNNSVNNESVKLVKYFKDNKKYFLSPDSSGYVLSSLYSTKASLVEGADYYLDRKFYPANEKGTKMFEENTKVYSGSYIESDFSASFSNGSMSEYLSINAYNPEDSTDSIIEANGLTADNFIEKLPITIKGTSVEASLYRVSYDYDYTMSSGGSDVTVKEEEAIARTMPACLDENCSYKTDYLLFKYEGQTYLITQSQAKETLKRFNVLDTSNSADLLNLENQIKNMYSSYSTVAE
jgi:hypothetical protein